MKQCLFCNQLLELNQFSLRNDKQNFSIEDTRKYSRYCKCCTSIKTKLSFFGISLEEFITLRNECNDSCQICGKSEIESRNAKTKHYGLYIDHCHETSKVRGLLCHSCNLIIGHAKDDTEKLKSAISYLERP